MPTTTTHGFVKPTSDLEPADMYGVATRLADSAETYSLLYGGQAYCELAATAATALGTAAWTKVALATTVVNNTSYFMVSSSVITVLVAGRYDISAMAGISGGASGIRSVAVSKNGLPDVGLSLSTVQDSTSTGHVGSPTGLAVSLAANDTIQLAGFSAAASLSTTHTALYVSRLMIRKVG